MLAGMLKLVNRITLSPLNWNLNGWCWGERYLPLVQYTGVHLAQFNDGESSLLHVFEMTDSQPAIDRHKGKRTWTLTLDETAVGSHKQLPRQTFTSRPRIYIWATARQPRGDVVYFWRRQFLTLSSHLLFPPTSETTLVSTATFWTCSHARQNASVGNVALYQPL